MLNTTVSTLPAYPVVEYKLWFSMQVLDVTKLRTVRDHLVPRTVCCVLI